MSIKFFQNFPKITYQNKAARNLILKAAFVRNIMSKYGIFYPYTIKNDERADMIAHQYYGSSEYTWLVYLSNDIINPYFDWVLTQSEFEKYIIKKYGSIEDAMELILHYRKNHNTVPADPEDALVWTAEDIYTDDYIMPVETYNQSNNLVKSFWNVPVYAYNYEAQLNDDRRTIQLFDNDLTGVLEKEISTIFFK